VAWLAARSSSERPGRRRDGRQAARASYVRVAGEEQLVYLLP